METLDLRGTGGDSDVGDIQELSPSEKAQITMTYWVLGGIAILFILSGAAYIWTDNGIAGFLVDVQSMCQIDDPAHKQLSDFCQKYISAAKSEANLAAKEIFEFCKNFLPPIVTLVLGAHYVTKSKGENS